MTSSKIMAYCASALFGLAMTAVPALADTLATAVTRTLHNFPELRAALADRSAAEDELEASRLQQKPRVDLAARNSAYATSSSHQDTMIISLSANQTIYDGGATASDRMRRRAELSAEEQRVADQAIDLGLQTVTAYLEVLQAQDILAATKRNIDSLKDIAQRVGLRVEAGFGADTDLLDVQLKLQTAEINLIDAQDRTTQAALAYRNLTGRTPIDLIPVRLPLRSLPSDVETAVQLARENSPKVMALVYDAQAADAITSGVLAAKRPQVGLDVGVNHNQDVGEDWNNSRDVSARLTFSVNLFDGGLTQARARKARHQAHASRYRAQTTGLQNEQRVRLAWANFMSGSQRIAVLTRQQQTARKTLGLYLKRFDAGVEPLQRILDLQSQSASADVARVSATYGNLLTGFRLLAGTGRLLPALGVTFDVQGVPRG
jgi:outer membrane protein, adhesin transport system